MKTTHARKGDTRRRVIFTPARVSLALLSLRKNGGLFVDYIDLSIDISIKIGKSDLSDNDCIDQSIEIDGTLVSFIGPSRFY